MPRERMRRSSRSRSVVRLNQGLLRHLMPQSTFGSRSVMPVNASKKGGFGAGIPAGGGGGGALASALSAAPPVGGPTPKPAGEAVPVGIPPPAPVVPPADTGQHPVYPAPPISTSPVTLPPSGYFPPSAPTFFSLPPAFIPAYTYPKRKPTGVSEY